MAKPASICRRVISPKPPGSAAIRRWWMTLASGSRMAISASATRSRSGSGPDESAPGPLKTGESCLEVPLDRGLHEAGSTRVLHDAEAAGPSAPGAARKSRAGHALQQPRRIGAACAPAARHGPGTRRGPARRRDRRGRSSASTRRRRNRRRGCGSSRRYRCRRAAKQRPAATAAAEPPLEPPEVRSGSQGLLVWPKSGWTAP